MKYYVIKNKYWLTSLLLVWVFTSCHQQEAIPVAYNEVSSVVGPEGKRLVFFEDKKNRGRGIDIDLYPILEFQPQTYSEPSVIELEVQAMSFNTLPDKLTPPSNKTYKWTIVSSNPVAARPIKLIIPFEVPDTDVWLEDYLDKFRLYKIRKDAATNITSDWVKVENAVLDVANRTVTADIDNFDFSYCVVFEEILRSDNIAITTQGSIDTILAGVASNYFSSTNPNSRGFYYRDGSSQFYLEGFWNEWFAISLTFNSNIAGSYTGNQIKLDYKYQRNPAWMHHFQATPTTVLTIHKYGRIGEPVEGNISGDLADVEDTGKIIRFNMDFKLIRTR